MGTDGKNAASAPETAQSSGRAPSTTPHLPKRRVKQIAVTKFRLVGFDDVEHVPIDVDDEDALASGTIIPVIVDAGDVLDRIAHVILNRSTGVARSDASHSWNTSLYAPTSSSKSKPWRCVC